MRKTDYVTISKILVGKTKEIILGNLKIISDKYHQLIKAVWVYFSMMKAKCAHIHILIFSITLN